MALPQLHAGLINEGERGRRLGYSKGFGGFVEDKCNLWGKASHFPFYCSDSHSALIAPITLESADT